MDIQTSDDFKRLTEINLEDMLVSLGWQQSGAARRLVRFLFRQPAEKFSRDVLDFDRGVLECGLPDGSRRILEKMVQGVRIDGAENIPDHGPTLILSNHPGMTDTVALFSAIPRQDLRVLAARRPFLELLQGTRQQLIFIPEGIEGRLEALRGAVGHLRDGGTLLTFPAGKIEPDPAAIPGAVEALQNWNPSTGLFARLAPQTAIVPVIVSGVLARQSLRHPLTFLRRSQVDRERLGASLQLIYHELWPKLWPVEVRVRFAPAIPASDLAGLREPEVITRAITDRIRPFLAEIVRLEFQTGR